MSEPIWISQRAIHAIHDRQISEHGGLPGVRDEGLLQSALSRPENLYFYGDPKPDISDMAAAYGFGISKNHPFNDGNKRTALIAIRLFLKLNGFDLTATGPEKFTMIVELASSHIDESDL